MTWGECRLAALQTMFVNEGKTLTADDSNQEYLDAMPAKANEALQQLCTVGRPLLKTYTVEIAEGAEETEAAGKLTLPAAEVRYKLKMTDYCPRWRCLRPELLMLESGGIYDRAEDFSLEGDDVLVLPGDITGIYTVWYAAYPQVITGSTADSEVLDLAPEAAALLPLYIAGELYKDDDLSMATMFRNEFEDGIQKLRQSYADQAKSFGVGRVRNTTGWW